MFKSNKSSKSQRGAAEVNPEKEAEFEESVQELLRKQDWEALEVASVDQLDATKARSPKGYMYLGIALYKMEYYEQACRAFQKSSEIKPDDAQLQYNLALSYFKDEKYNLAVEHFKLCTQMDA